jgi:hypothetical protein
MDAYTRNKCEHELLQNGWRRLQDLEIKLKVETEAFKEIGLSELWTFKY